MTSFFSRPIHELTTKNHGFCSRIYQLLSPILVGFSLFSVGCSEGFKSQNLISESSEAPTQILLDKRKDPTPNDLTYSFVFSLAIDRSNPIPLTDARVQGAIYPFLSPGEKLKKVVFFLDDTLVRSDRKSPFDAIGGSVNEAKALDTFSLSNDWHTFRAELSLTSGEKRTIEAAFFVANSAPPPPPPEIFQCSDGIDNDADGFSDFPDDPGCSSLSDNDEFDIPSTDTTAPTPPANLLASASSPSQVSLSWDASFDEVGMLTYHIERCEGALCNDFAQVQSISGTNFFDQSLIPETTYQYRTRAEDGSQNLSEYSNLVLVTTPAAPTNISTYYIDQTAGSDANPGTRDLPWKNAPGMSGQSAHTGGNSLQPGDVVYFDRDDTWEVSGSATQGFFLTGGVSYIGDEWEADAGSSSTRSIIRALNDFLQVGVVRFTDHPSEKTIFKGFEVDANGMAASGVDINHGRWSLMNGATKRVENVIVHDVFTEQSKGEYKYGIAMSNFGGSAGILENVEIIGCIVHDIGRDGIVLYPSDDPNSRIGNIIVRDTEVYATGQDPNYSEGHGIVAKGWVYNSLIENNYIHDVNSSAIFISGPEDNGSQRSVQDLHIRNNILSSQDNNGIIRLYKSGAKDVKIYGNILFDNNQTGGLSLGGNSGDLDLLVYNNTFYNAFVDLGYHSSRVIRFDFINNIVHSQSTPLRNFDSLTSNSNNLIVTTDPGFKNANNKPSGFIGVYGVDLRPSSDGFTLLSGSSAIDAGLDLPSQYSGSINSLLRPQNLAWDIGAYESLQVTDPQEPGPEPEPEPEPQPEPPSGSDVSAASCSQVDVTSAISTAPIGVRVLVPPGNCAWGGFALSRAIHLKGAGIGLTNITLFDGNSITKQADGITRVSGFSFFRLSGDGEVGGIGIWGSWLNSEPVVIEHNSFEVAGGAGLFHIGVTGGVIFSYNEFTGGWDDSFLQIKVQEDTFGSWSTTDSMGDRDVDGKKNFYVENNSFYGGTNQGIDCDDSSRCVYRYNDLTYSSFNTHGLGTSPVGIRHFEVYNNAFHHDGGESPIANQNWAIWIRGGSGVIFDNEIPNMAGPYWGDKSEIIMTIRAAEDTLDVASCDLVSYPISHQLGRGHDGTSDILDPIYVWGNSSAIAITPGFVWGNPCGFDFSTFFQWGRDGFKDGRTKPGYKPYTYPHPLASAPQP